MKHRSLVSKFEEMALGAFKQRTSLLGCLRQRKVYLFLRLTWPGAILLSFGFVYFISQLLCLRHLATAPTHPSNHVSLTAEEYGKGTLGKTLIAVSYHVGNARLNTEGGSISWADLRVLTG